LGLYTLTDLKTSGIPFSVAIPGDPNSVPIKAPGELIPPLTWTESLSSDSVLSLQVNTSMRCSKRKIGMVTLTEACYNYHGGTKEKDEFILLEEL